MIPTKIENVFIEVNTTFSGVIKSIIAGKFAQNECTPNTTIFTACPYLIGTLDALPISENITMEGMIINVDGIEHFADVELFKTKVDISILIHNRTNVYKVVNQLNQNRNDLFFLKREILEKNKELTFLRKVSDKANEEKTRFLAMMSHEVRNPLNTILGYTEMISEEKLSKKAQEYINYLALAGKNLKVIVDDILDLSRIEAGKLQLASEEINLKELLKSIFINYQYQHKNKQVDLRIVTSENIPEVVIGDGVRVNQIVSNLMSNALKFTKNGSISLQVEFISDSIKHAEVRFKIIDTGRGMTADQTAKIFEEYGQTELDDNRVFGGAGLGLSIVKLLVEAMNGSISVASELNVGTTFSVDIPFQKVTNKNENKEIALKPKVLKSLKGKHILLADDGLLNQKITSYFLQKEEVSITIAKDGLEALNFINEQAFDMIILDINMPEITGETLIQQKTTYQKNGQIPFLALTGNATPEDKAHYLKIGFSQVIFKPYKPEELIEKIKGCF